MDAQPIPQTRPLAHVRASWGEWLAAGMLTLLFGAGAIVVVPVRPTTPGDLIACILYILICLSVPFLFIGAILQYEVIAAYLGVPPSFGGTSGWR